MQPAIRKMLCFGRIGLLCLLLAAAAGCATLGNNPKSQEKLAKAADEFNTALRWGDYKQAAQWIAPSRQQQFWTQCDQMQKRIRLTGYEIRHVGWNDTETSQIFVYYSYYYTDDPSLRHKTLQQQWRYVPQLKKWEVTQTALAQLMPQ